MHGLIFKTSLTTSRISQVTIPQGTRRETFFIGFISKDAGIQLIICTCHLFFQSSKFINNPKHKIKKSVLYVARGPMEKASDYESGNRRFESCRGQIFFLGEKTKVLGQIIKEDSKGREIDRSSDH